MDTYGPQGVSGEAISSFVSANIGDPGAIASAAAQYGLSASDLAAATGYSPAQQASYFGSAGVDTSGIAGLSNFLSSATPSGEQGPTYGNQSFTADVIKNFVTQNLGDPGAIARAMSQYDVSQQNLANIYQGLYTPTQISSYLSSPQASLYGTGQNQVTGREVVDYISNYLNDPTRVYQAAASRGLTADDLYAIAQQGYAPSFTQQNIQDYLTTGQQGFANRFADIAQGVFGSPEEIEVIANAVYNQNKARIINDPTLTTEQKRQALAQTRDDFISKNYGLEQYANTSLEDIESSLRESGANKLQEAYRLGNIASEYLGYSKDDAQALINKALTGQGMSEPEQKIFDTLLQQHEVSSKSQNDLLTYAAMTNPEAPIFQKNPALLPLYTPLPGVVEKTSDSKWGGGSGQYGYFEGAPVLNADVARSIVGEHGQTTQLNSDGRNYSNIAKTLGMDFASHGETTMWKAGRSVVGVDFDKQYINDLANLERGINNGTIREVRDPESNTTVYFRQVGETFEPINGPSLPRSSATSGYASAPQSMQEVQDKLVSAASKLGISTQGKSVDRLFDEITDKTTGLYQIVGNSSAIDREAYPDAKNHINAIYKQVSNKLLPVDINFFHADAPKKKGFGPIGGFVGDMLSGIASIPGIAELAVVASGGTLAPYYPAIKAIQVGGLTDDWGKGLTAGAKAWITQQGVAMADQAIGGYLIDAGITDIDMVNTLSSVGANVAANMGLAALSGQDISDAGIASLVASAVGEATKGAVGKAGIPPQYQAAVTQILADAILKNDLQKSLSRIALKEVTKGVKDVQKEMSKEKVAA